jgi:Transglycosylase SLT domain
MSRKHATRAIGLTIAALLGLMTATAEAKPVRPTDDSKSCRSHVTAAEQRHRIPRGLLHAIAMTESTYNPLALNIEGRNVGVPTVDQALLRIRQAQDQGIQNISIGCLQILVKYHVHRVGTTRDLIEPGTNAAYGARYLRELYRQTGDWWRAVARYHTSDVEKQAIYLCRVYGNYASLRNIPIDERAYRERCGRTNAV